MKNVEIGAGMIVAIFFTTTLGLFVLVVLVQFYSNPRRGTEAQPLLPVQ